MKKNKKILAFTIAMNAALATYASGSGSKALTTNYNNLYNKIKSNINSGKSNGENYKLIENVLKKRNKELKDLYTQGDYIIKPEYLEWQIFVTGFYAERGNGDNTSENARYNSKTEGYFDENGRYVAGSSGKPYKDKQEAKIIDLGMSIPLKEINRESLDIQVNPSVTKPVIPEIQGMTAVSPLSIPVLDLFTFNPVAPEVVPITPPEVSIKTPSLAPYVNDAEDTLLGKNKNIDPGTYNLSEGSDRPADSPGNLHKDHAIMEYNRAGSYSSSADTVMNIDVSKRAAITIDGELGSLTGVTFTNKGTINLINDNTAGLEIQTNPENTTFTMINDGNILGSRSTQAGMLFTVEESYGGTSSKHVFINNGTIKLNGSNSVGIALPGRAGHTYKIDALNSGTIELNGENSFGIAVPENSNLGRNSGVTNDIDGEILVNGNKSGGVAVLSNIIFFNNGTINVKGDDSFGMYSGSDGYGNYVMNNGLINIINAKNSIGLRTDEKGGITNTGNIIIEGGEQNIGMYGNFLSNRNGGNIKINGTGSIGASGKLIWNSGIISVKGDGVTGILLKNNSYFYNDFVGQDGGHLLVEGKNIYGIVAMDGSVVGIESSSHGPSGGGSIKINADGPNSIGLYAKNNSIIDLRGMTGVTIHKVEVIFNNGGVNFFAEEKGKIYLDGKFVVGQKSLGFYTKNGGEINMGNQQNTVGTIKGGTSSENRGTAFYLTGKGTDYYPITTITDIENLLSTSGINIEKLELNMESGSRLFSMENIALNLNALNDIDTLGFSKIKINGNDYIKMLLHKSHLNIDAEADLDDPASNYSKIELVSSSVTNNNIIKGTGNSKQGIAQANGIGTAKKTVTLINNGEINLKGNESVGIYGERGIINNNGIIDMQGQNAYGIYGVNGTDVTTGTGSIIKAGEKGAGIVLQSNIINSSGVVSNTSGNDGTFKLDHNGKIIMSGSNSFGIYADNNDTSALSAADTRIVNLNSGSMVDMSGTTAKGTGLYANKSTVNTSGDMKIGTEGIGIYAKDSNVNLTGGTIDILGSGSTGIFLDGTSNVTATGGIINVKGDNTTVFFINSSPTTITGIENIQINVDPNSKMTLINVKNSSFIHNGILNLSGKGSVLIAGDNSDIGFGSNAVITSSSENITGLAAKGGSAVNKGALTLTGSNSMGIYTENANATNESNLILGLNGVGIYNENGIVNNQTGKIETGEKGVGVYGVNSASINNSTLISSTGNSAIGIYAEGDTTETIIKNESFGVIDLSGSSAIGIYTTGTKAKNVTNTGVINIGDSSDINNPSIGIYNNILGNIIQNNGIITLGKNSLGIYDKGGSVTENGTLNIGEAGTGILSDNGIVNITSTSNINIGGNSAVGIYGKNNASITNASSNILIGNGSYGFVLETGSNLSNTSSVTLGDNSVLVYGKGAGIITSSNTASITATGSDNVVFYTTDGGTILNDSSIKADTGMGNIGIYNKDGSIENKGNISLGDSALVYNEGAVDPDLSRYSVGVYGENSTVINRGDISLGANAVGVYVKDNQVMAKNYGNITAGSLSSPKVGAIGIFADGGKGVENFGDITLFGDKSIGIAGKNATIITNHATISVTGAETIGIYGTLNTVVDNKGTINVSGKDSVGIVAPNGKIINEGTINYTDGASASKEEDENEYPLPELINMGIIKVDGHFDNTGMDLSIKPNLDTLKPSTIPGVDFTINAGTISANSMTITDTINILPDFTQGTNAGVYKLENTFMTSEGQIISSNGKIPLVSKSLTWEATPRTNAEGNVDIYMTKIDYHKFTDGLWYDDFGKALDGKYVGSTGEAGSIFDKIDLIEHESDFRHVMGSLAGNVYSNMNQRQEDISRAFDSSLSLMENSKNNTKENVKLNVIAGRGRTKEETDGVVGYDYTTTGILALREVERTYRHKFGYSLGYLHTGFEFKDGNESEEWVDTIQLGLHSKYDVNNWVLKNNITGRVSIHNIDRNIDWPSPTGRSELNGTYETYSISSDNRLGKELTLGKNGSLTPYGGIKATYITRPTFSEKGLESLEVEGNDAWSVKPRAGVELKGSLPLGSSWQLKGALDVSYEYELANLNERERAKLTKIEDNYHNLSKPEKEKGTIRTKAEIGVEVEDRYGIFLTGEYGAGSKDKDEYRAGVTLKAVF